MFCIKCGALLDDDSVFCALCGERVYPDGNGGAEADKPSESKSAEAHNEDAFCSEVLKEQGFIDPDKTVGAHYLRKKNNSSPEVREVAKQSTPQAQPYSSDMAAEDKNRRYDSRPVNIPPVADKVPDFGTEGFNDDIAGDGFFDKGIGESFFDDENKEEKKEENKPDKKKNNKTKIIALIAALLAVATASAAVFVFMGKSGGGSYFNTFNMSSDIISVARDADTIFYINENGYIVKMDVEDNERSIIVDDKSADMIYIQDETLYFRSPDDNCLYMCDFEGDNIEKTVSQKISWFTIIDEELYYTDGYYETDDDTGEEIATGQFNLYKSKLDGSNEKQVVDDSVNKVFIGKDSIVYYNKEADSLYKTDIDGEDRKLLYSCEDNAFIGDIKLSKDTVLFTYIDTDNKILSGVYSVGIDGEGKKKIAETYESSITLRGGSLIYASSEDSCTYICSTDGSDEDDLFDISAYSPVISGNYMYFFNSEDEKLSVMEYDFKNDELRYLEDDLYGKTVFTKNYIFYISSDDNNIYRCDHTGKDAVQLTSGECLDIYSYNDEIYYIGYANGYDSDSPETLTGIDTYGLYKLDADGDSCTAVEFSCEEKIAFCDDYVYFTAGEPCEIYRTELSNVDTTASDVPFITESFGITYGDICFVADGWIYLHATREDSPEIIRINIDTQAVETIFEGEAYNVTYSEGKIFYMAYDENDDAVLYYMLPDGSINESIITVDTDEYVVSENIVFYIDPMNGNLCMIGVNGSNNNTLCDTAAANISVFDGLIYFTDRYENGYTYSIETDGSSKEEVIGEIEETDDKTSYKTEGVDGASPAVPVMPAV